MVLEPAKNKGIEIVYNIPNDFEVFADNNMLQTIIRNLVSNAVKYTPRGGKVKLSSKAQSDKSVEISVQDNGIVMNREMVGNLFRIDVQTKQNASSFCLSCTINTRQGCLQRRKRTKGNGNDCFVITMLVGPKETQLYTT